MLQKKPRPLLIRCLRKVFYACANPLQKIYWLLFRPYRPGAKTFVFNQDKLLLVRLGYGHKKWVLPGGGIDKGENGEEAAKREVKEEAGLDIENLIYIGKRFNTNQYKKVDVFYYTTKTYNSNLVIDNQEIVDAGWFKINELPEEITPRLKEEIMGYNNWKDESK